MGYEFMVFALTTLYIIEIILHLKTKKKLKLALEELEKIRKEVKQENE